MKKILIVEDHADIRKLIRMTLEFRDFDVQEVATGDEAWEVTQRIKPDVVLLDVMMPGFDGPDTLRALADRPGMLTVPVYFMTAQVMTEELDRLYALGAAGVVTKPFDPMTLPGDIFERVRIRSR